jgi:uncharacterized protein (DUF58 family)
MYLGLTVLVGFAAMNGQNNLLFWILGVMISALLISGLVSGLMMRGLRVRRLVTRHGVVGEPLTVRYAVTNLNRFVPVFSVHITERPVSGASGWTGFMAPAEAWIMHLGPRETVHGEAIFWPRRRGEARFDQLRIWTTFPFGIIKKSVTFSQPQPALVYPQLYELRRRVVNAITPQGLAGALVSRRAGAGDDYYGMREFRQGDTLRQVAWKRTAGLDELVCIERTQPAPPKLRVVVNLTTPTRNLRVDPGSVRDQSPQHLEELSISLAASIIHAADQNGFEVGLSLPGTGLPPLPIRRSQWHRAKMMAALAGIDLDAERVPSEGPLAIRPERAGQIVVHPDRVEPSMANEDAWHVTARQLTTLALRPIGWAAPCPPPTPQPRESAA